MTIIEPPPPPEETPAERAVRESFSETAEEKERRIAFHQRTFQRVWGENNGYTPAQFFAAAGPQGVRFMQIGGASKDHLAALAAIEGKTLDDYLSPEEYDPPLPYTAHPDGTITIDEP